MNTHIVLCSFTEQGIKAFRETGKRADAFIQTAAKAGVTVKSCYWTLGAFDLVITVEAADDAAVAATLLNLGSLGNIRTQSLRAFSRTELDGVLAKAR